MKNDFNEYLTREFKRDPDAFLDSLPQEFVDSLRKRDLKNVRSQLPMGKHGQMVKQKQKPDNDFVKYIKNELAK